VPTIPSFYTREALPATSGSRGGVSQVPVVQQPGTQDTGPSAMEKSLGVLPEALQQTGQLVARTEELGAHRQKAYDTIKGTSASQDYRLDMAPAYNEWRKGDWESLPDRVRTEGERLMKERGRDLTPYARAIYEQHAKETLNIFQDRALAERSKRADEAANFTFAREMQQAQEAIAGAHNDYERQVAKGQRDEVAKRWVDSGLADGVKVATILKNTDDAIDLEHNKMAIQANPEAMRDQYQAQLEGKATRADLPLAPPMHLAELAAEARQTHQQRLGHEEHVERRADYQHAKQQEQAANEIRGRLTSIRGTQEDLPAYDALLAEVNQKAQGAHPTISGEAQREFTTHIRSLRTAAANPRQVDDAKVEMKLGLMLDAADNEADYASVRSMVIQQAGMLTPETRNRLLNTIYERKASGHYSHLNGYKEGLRAIMGGDIAEGTMMAMFRGTMKEGDQLRMRNALTIYQTRMAELSGQSREQANADGLQIGLEIRRAYIDLPAREEKYKALPLPLQRTNPDETQGIADEQEALAIIAKLPQATKAMRQDIYDQWKAWRYSPVATESFAPKTPPPKISGGAPAPPKRQLVQPE
jgi:hypothetical protein